MRGNHTAFLNTRHCYCHGNNSLSAKVATTPRVAFRARKLRHHQLQHKDADDISSTVSQNHSGSKRRKAQNVEQIDIIQEQEEEIRFSTQTSCQTLVSGSKPDITLTNADVPRDGESQECVGQKDVVQTLVSVLKPRITLSNGGELRDGESQEKGPGQNDVVQLVLPVASLFDADAIGHAVAHLKASDPKLRAVIEVHERPTFQKCSSPFTALVRSIVYQQLATNAAAAIYKRLVSLCGTEDSVTPATIAHLTATDLRSIGLSHRKASYLHDLAKNFVEGPLSDAAILLMEDSKLMSSLTAVKGIGVWSVHMFMIFSLHRPDVLPVSDLGVRKGFQKLYNLKVLPSATDMEQLAASWRPFRSLGAWYMWRLIGTKAPIPVL